MYRLRSPMICEHQVGVSEEPMVYFLSQSKGLRTRKPEHSSLNLSPQVEDQCLNSNTDRQRAYSALFFFGLSRLPWIV